MARPKKKIKRAQGPVRAVLTQDFIWRIHQRSMCDRRVIKAWAEGWDVRPSTKARIERACREIGMPAGAWRA